jgi:hypothetical protein
MTKARDIADLGAVTSRLDTVGASDGALSNRNLIINGAMQVAQRGTSITVSNNNWLYLMDRFQFDENGATSAVLDVTQSTDAPDGFGYSLKMTATTADPVLASGDGLRLQYRIEAQDLQILSHGTSEAKPVTLSFWVKSKTTGTNGIWVYKADSSRQTSFSYTINAADTWEYKTIIIPADTSGAINNDNGEGLRISWYLAAGTDFNSGTLDSSWASLTSANRAVGQVNNFSSTSDYWALTGVQLEVGDTATPFEHRSYGDELARCQRYFQIYRPNRENAVYTSFSNQFHMGQLTLQGQMRADPTATWYDGSMRFAQVGYNAVSDTMTNATAHNLITTNMERQAVHFVITRVAGGSTPSGDGVYNSEGSGARFFLDAEL